MRLFIATHLLAWATVATANAATFHFDLTDAVGPDFNAFPEAEVDLNQQFSRIDHAQVLITGEFTQGVMTPATNPPQTGPLLSSDTVYLIIRLGEIGTAFVEKQTFAIQDLQGYRGPIDLALPLLSTAASSDLPVLFPSADAPGNYDFLLDGRFGVAAGSTHFVASLFQVLESPQFELSECVLRIDGVAIPEPATGIAFMIAIGVASSAQKKLRRRQRK